VERCRFRFSVTVGSSSASSSLLACFGIAAGPP
jgi:hypothetical protein